MDAYLEISEKIKKETSEILMAAVNRSEPRYLLDGQYIRWGLVEREIHNVIETNLVSDNT